MKTYNLKTIYTLCFFVIALTACKKNTTTATVVEETTQAKVQSDDASIFAGETESADDDVNNAAATSERFCGVGNVYNIPFTLLDGTITLPTATSSKLYITYNGNNVGTCKKRTGTITIELVNGTRWVDVGAILKYTFINFKVENICTNRSIKINGERYVTNVSGGNLFKLRNGIITSLKHKIRTGSTGLQATFTDSTSNALTAIWNIARLTTIEYDASNNRYYFNAAGDTTIYNKANTESWGTTRYGNSYQTVYSTSVKANTGCKLWRPTAGELIHYVNNTTISVKYGLNILGNPVGANDCAEYFKVNWLLANGTTGSSPLTPYRF
jgi:hypothetical protein